MATAPPAPPQTGVAPQTASTLKTNIGHIVQVQGPVVDVSFPPDHLPPINNAITIADPTRGIELTVEVAQHLGNDVVRCIAMSSTDGLVRGMEVTNTGQPITVPVG